MTVSSRRHNDVCGLFLPSTGLIENSLFVGVLSHESCHSSMHSLDICGKKLCRNLAFSDDKRVDTIIFIHYSARRCASIGFTLRLVLTVFTRSAITPLKMNRFG